MRYAALTCLFAMTLAHIAWSAEIPEFNTIRTPDSPAFVVLGLSPTDIQRPTTPREIAVSLASVVTKQEDLSIPKSLALEVAPYWLVSHHKLTFERYSSNVGRALRDFTLSLGTTTTDASDTSSNATRLAVGLRTNVLRGNPTSDARAAKSRIEALSQDIAARAGLLAEQITAEKAEPLERSIRALNDSINVIDRSRQTSSVKARGRTLRESRDSLQVVLASVYKQLPTVIEARQRAVFEAELERIQKAADEEAKKLAARRGLIASVAAGCAWKFPNGTFEAGKWNSSRGWFTAGYEAGSGENLLMSVRYGGEDKGGPDPEWSVDMGIRGIIARARYAASAEVMYRDITSASAEPGQYRVASAVDYMVHDGSWLTISFGKDFEGDNLGSLFTLASLKWGFGNPSIKVEGE